MLLYFADMLLSLNFPFGHGLIGGYWCNYKECFESKHNCNDNSDQDFLSFLEWFDKIEVDENDETGFCVSSCEPSQNNLSTPKRYSVKGTVTNIVDDHGLIDHYIYFHYKDLKGFGNKCLPSVGDVVYVEAEQTRAEGGWKAYHVTYADEKSAWDEENASLRIPTSYEERGAMIGKITELPEKEKHGRIENKITFTLADIDLSYKPSCGDWVQAAVSPGGFASNIKPIRVKQLTGTVTYITQKGSTTGSINNDIFYDISVCASNYFPRRNDQVAVVAVESKQGRLNWRATEVKFIGRTNQRQSSEQHTKSGAWVLRGERPTFKTSLLPMFLPQFTIPDSLRTCLQTGGDLLSLRPKLCESLSVDNYKDRFSTLLHLEEIAVEAEMNSYRLCNVTLSCRGEFLVLNVPGLGDGKPSLLLGDSVKLTHVEAIDVCGVTDPIEYEGFIHHISMDTEELLLKFHDQLQRGFDESARFNVSFSYSRTPYRRCHMAVKLAKDRYAEELLFPKKNSNFSGLRSNPQSNIQLLVSDRNDRSKTCANFVNQNLNERQKSAVQRILEGAVRPKPYILFGPPGTGKTVTLVEAILQVVTHIPSCRLLICAPSNSAVDLLCERLHDSGLITCNTMVRFNAFRRPLQVIPEKVRLYCPDNEPLTTTARYKIVLSTCVNVGQFYALGLNPEHFTHVYIDEAGQATEPECLIPIGLGFHGQIVLTGDPKQLGSVVKSSFASHYGLGISLLQRLMCSEEYSRNLSIYQEGFNPVLVTKLVNNYRSHPCLLTVPSKLFYDNELQPFAPKSLVTSFCGWDKLTNLGFPSLFHGIVGTQLREENSPSWFNAEEVVQVCRYVKLLLNEKNYKCVASDIGVITPYKKQVEKLRMMFRALHVAGVKVGSVEEFQGQERKIIILTTVRSKNAVENFDDGSVISALGFLSNPQRFNVAITRAIALLIIVGNPLVLVKDDYWKILLKHHVDNNAYTGHEITSFENLLQ